MTITNGTCKVNRISEKKTAVRLRIPQDKDRARRWAERRKERNPRVILLTEDCKIIAVAVSTHEPQASNQIL